MDPVKQSPLAAAGQTALKAVTPDVLEGLMSKLNLTKSPETIPEAPVGPKKMSGLGNVLGGLLKTVGPSLVSLIPGVGPIASKLLSTMNDDEWFEAYKGTGASYNDLLVTMAANGVSGTILPEVPVVIRPRAAYARYMCSVERSDAFYESFMPSVLAYIRSKTTNVLVADVSFYTTAFKKASSLYAIYYVLSKYIAHAEKLPINVPVPTTKLSLIAPTTYSQLVGVRDALKQYLQSTVTLPYAWVSYLRWRYGTMFQSSNSGKPGFIAYDYYSTTAVITGDSTLTTVTTEISALQAALAAASRASADFKLAYANHVIQWDVDPSHYDEKEFNLRTNLTVDGEPFFGLADENMIIMDSRLDNSAASQAITISTATTVNGTTGTWQDDPLNTPIGVQELRLDHYVVFDPALIAITNRLTFAKLLLGAGAPFPGGWMTQTVAEQINTVGIMQVIDTASNYSAGVAYARSASLLGDFSKNDLVAALMGSLQIHVSGKFTPYAVLYSNARDGITNGTYYAAIARDTISYDQANVSPDQIKSLNRTAMRNLTRGDYANKSNSVEDVKAVKDAAIGVVDTLAPSK